MSQVKTDFFNNVSHELRTPLTLIMAPLEDALKDKNGHGKREELEMALHNSKRLLNLTNELLDLSKLDAAKLELDVSTTEISPLLIRIVHSFQSLAQTRKIHLHHNLNKSIATHLNVDVGKLEKILNNLINNAIKYSEDGGTVSVTLDYDALDQGSLSLSIQDDGPGIPIEDQERIFNRFYQSSVVIQSAGTGIGLALVKELVQLMGGRISLESAPGNGSCFQVDLPVTIVATPEREPQKASVDEEVTFEPILFGDHKPKVLIVEDDLEMSRYLKGLLKEDYDLDIAFNGIQALEKCRHNRYDLISSDVMMPEMDGFEFRNRLNEMGQGHTPFIMLTARVLEEDRLRGFRLGVDDYITKPFSSEEYKARIHNLLSNKQKREQIDLGAEEIPSHEEEFVNNVREEVITHLDDPNYSVSLLAQSMNYSPRQLGRLLQRYTGLTPVQFILELRLQKAFQIIQSRKYATINEVRYDVGIESASYFSARFKERFGISPASILS